MKGRPREPEGSEGMEFEDGELGLKVRRKIMINVEDMRAAAVMSCTKINKESIFG